MCRTVENCTSIFPTKAPTEGGFIPQSRAEQTNFAKLIYNYFIVVATNYAFTITLDNNIRCRKLKRPKICSRQKAQTEET